MSSLYVTCVHSKDGQLSVLPCPSAVGQPTAHKNCQEKFVLNMQTCKSFVFFHHHITYCVTQSSRLEGARCVNSILFYEWTGESEVVVFFRDGGHDPSGY